MTRSRWWFLDFHMCMFNMCSEITNHTECVSVWTWQQPLTTTRISSALDKVVHSHCDASAVDFKAAVLPLKCCRVEEIWQLSKNFIELTLSQFDFSNSPFKHHSHNEPYFSFFLFTGTILNARLRVLKLDLKNVAETPRGDQRHIFLSKCSVADFQKMSC